MTAKTKRLEILAIGLDSFSIEAIKKSLKDNRIPYHFSLLREVSEIESFSRKNIQSVFYFSNRQSERTVENIRRLSMHLPQAAITLLSPRTDHHGVIACFRAGLFDFLTLPIDQHEMRTVIYRLKLFGAAKSGQWTPERAVLHLFSKPENFSSAKDVAAGLNQYLGLFFDLEKETSFNASQRMIKSLGSRLKLSGQQMQRIDRFLNDETGLVFGLRYRSGRFYFLVKTEEGKLSYLVARKKTEFPIRSILSDYLSNVLRTSLAILTESRRREEIRLLSVTDEVTGLFNQRKLVEDLELYISRYQHDGIGFSLLFVDIDYFKNVNDQFGHVIGSQLLIDMAKVVKAQLRSSDLVYRYGGDEFIVLLPKSNVEESKRVALRISEAVKTAEFNINNEKTYQLSLSVGIAEFPTDATSAKEIINFADKMMYLSKKSGRGKVFHVTEVVA